MDSSKRLDGLMDSKRVPASLRRCFLRVLLLASFFGTSGSWAAGPKLKFDLHADEFPKAILEYSHQSKIEVFFLANDSLRAIRTQPVVGELDAHAALERMLKGTGLAFDFDPDDRSVTIRQVKVASAPALPAPHAEPKKPEPSAHHLASAAPMPAPTSDVAEVTVTGTYLHTAMDVQAPLLFVSQSDFSRAAYPTVQDALYQLPMNSLNAPREDLSINNNFNWGSAVNLRGLGVPATLVLVNGHRQPFSGYDGDFVDISNIPAAAIERIEILPDGASALYGSDAVAGVVNIILKDHFDGARTEVQYGGAPGGRDQLTVSQLLGTHWGSGKAMLVYEYLDATDLPASARGYAANANKTVPYGGADYRTYFTDPGNILDFNQQPLRGISTDTVNQQNQFAPYQIFPEITSHSVYGNLFQHVGDHVELFAEGRYTQRDTYIQRFPEPETLVVPGTNPYNSSGNTTLVAYNFGRLLGPETFGGDTRNYLGTVGARFRFGEWRTTLSESYGRETLFNSGYNQVNTVALQAALDDANPATAFNAFGGATNPATVAAINYDSIIRSVSAIEATSLVTDGPLFDLPAGAAQLAVGFERREESLQHTVPVSLTSQATMNARYGRHVGSAFTELLVPLVGDAEHLHAPPRLELNLAARYDDYSDFGHTVNPEFRLRWVPLEWLKWRASWGRSYRAPKLTDLYDSTNNASGELVLSDPASPTGRSTVLGVQGNNPNLKPETAKTWTAGLDVVPAMDPGLKLSLTYYSIDYEGQITMPAAANPFDVLVQGNEWAAVITRNPTQGQIAAVCNRPDYYGSRALCLASSPAAIVDYQLANLSSTKVTGLDVDVHQSLDNGMGHFELGLTGDYVFHFDQAVTSTSPVVDILNTFGNPLKLRFRATAGWSQYKPQHPDDIAEGFGANLTVNFTNGYRNPGSPRLPHINSLTTLDLHLRYGTGQEIGPWGGLELSLNAVNALNQSPPFADNLYGYDTSNFQGLGRVLSLAVRKKW